VARRTGQKLLQFDRKLGARFVAGVDEAGRGSLAGPLVCAGVLLDYAALLGREPDPNVLENLLSKGALYRGLSACADLALMEVRNGAWRFSHDKFRERLLQRMDFPLAVRLHSAVAQAIEAIYPQSEDHYPVLAHHFQSAGEQIKETHYATLAGRSAIRKGAYREALPLLNRALELQRSAPVRDEKAELGVLLNLGSVLITLRGWFAPEVRTTYDEAFVLARRTLQVASVAPVLIGLSKFFFLKGQLSMSTNYARQCLEAADATGDPIMRQHGRLMMGEASVWLGEFARDPDYAAEIAKLYDPSQATVHLSLYGQNPRLTSMGQTAAGLWMQGHPDQALALSLEARTFVARDGNAFSLAIADHIAAWVYLLRSDVDETYTTALSLGELSANHGFVPFQVLAQIYLGWVDARRGSAPAGVQRIRSAIERWRALGAALSLTYYFMIFADACLAGNLYEEGLAAVEEALSGKLETEERCYQPELRRLEAEFHAHLGNLIRAHSALDQALAVALEQHAKGFELRILTTMYRLQAATPAAAPTRNRLEELCGYFRDKGRTPDLTAALRLLRRSSSA